MPLEKGGTNGTIPCNLPHNTSIPPIYRLPREILSEIFEAGFVAPEESWYYSTDTWGAKPFVDLVLAVSWTSSRLRSAIIRTPRCWSYVSIQFARNKFTPTTPLVELFLLRSAPRPLYLSVNFDEWSGDPESTLPLMQLLRTHAAARLRSLSIRTLDPAPDDFPPTPGLFDGVDLPSLRLLNISQDYEEHDEFLNNQVSSLRLSKAPLIALAVIRVMECYNPVYLPAISFASLKRLHVGGWVNGVSMPTSLLECTVLEHLWWEWIEDDDDETLAQPQLELPHLISLRLHTLAIEEMPPLIAPRLEQMILDDSEHDPDTGASYNVPHFLTASPTSFPLLKRLAVFWTCLNNAERVAALRWKCPDLEELSFFGFEHTFMITASIAHVVAFLRPQPSSHYDNDSADADADGQVSSSLKRRQEEESSSRPSPTPFHLELVANPAFVLSSDVEALMVYSAMERALLAIPRLKIHYVSSVVPSEPLSASLAQMCKDRRLVFGRQARWEQWPNAWRLWCALC